MLSKPGSAKETRHFIVGLTGSGLHYKAGDSLGIFPSNRDSEVNEILERLGATGHELVSPAMLKLAAPAAAPRGSHFPADPGEPDAEDHPDAGGQGDAPGRKVKLTDC